MTAVVAASVVCAQPTTHAGPVIVSTVRPTAMGLSAVRTEMAAESPAARVPIIGTVVKSVTAFAANQIPTTVAETETSTMMETVGVVVASCCVYANRGYARKVSA
jgi:hypothetical protein